MSIRKPLIGFSLFAIITLVLTWIIWSTLERPVDGDTRTYSVTFNDASGLSSADDVRMAGVRVGRVNSVERDGNRAKVKFEVEADQPVYANTDAAIKYQNLIGQRYLRLTLGGAPTKKLNSGSKLTGKVEDSFDVSGLLAGFQPVFDTLKPAEVNQLSDSIVKALQGDGVNLSFLLQQIGQVASDLGSRDTVISSIIDNLSGVMGDLSKQTGQLRGLVTGMSGLVGSLNTNSATFGKAVTDIGKTTTVFANILSQIRPNAVSGLTDLRTATGTLMKAGDKIESMGKTTPILLGYLAKVMGEGAWLNLYVCDLDISIGNVLFPPGLINKIGGTQHSAVCR